MMFDFVDLLTVLFLHVYECKTGDVPYITGIFAQVAATSATSKTWLVLAVVFWSSSWTTWFTFPNIHGCANDPNAHGGTFPNDLVPVAIL